MPRILLQFHATGRCNLRCRHCYREEGNVQPLSTADVLEVLRQYEELKDAFNAERGSTRRGHINLTGGEPFVRKDFFEIYRAMKQMGLLISINSNGSMLRGEILDRLLEDPPTRINISLYGGSTDTYAAMCGRPAYDQVVENIRTSCPAADCALARFQTTCSVPPQSSKERRLMTWAIFI